jgi:hypothetical protein
LEGLESSRSLAVGVADLAYCCSEGKQAVEWFPHIHDPLRFKPKADICSGQLRQYNDLLKVMRPAGPYNSREYFFNATTSTTSIIRDPLYEFLQMRVRQVYSASGNLLMHGQQQVGQASTAVEQLLRALWHSEFQCRFGSYRTAIILLADVGLKFGMTKRSKRVLEEIMPQVSGPIIWLSTILMYWFRSLTVMISSSVPSPALLLHAVSSRRMSSHQHAFAKPYRISILLRRTMRPLRSYALLPMCSSSSPFCTTTST